MRRVVIPPKIRMVSPFGSAGGLCEGRGVGGGKDDFRLLRFYGGSSVRRRVRKTG